MSAKVELHRTASEELRPDGQFSLHILSSCQRLFISGLLEESQQPDCPPELDCSNLLKDFEEHQLLEQVLCPFLDASTALVGYLDHAF
jgi:hypothetical protein